MNYRKAIINPIAFIIFACSCSAQGVKQSNSPIASGIIDGVIDGVSGAIHGAFKGQAAKGLVQGVINGATNGFSRSVARDKNVGPRIKNETSKLGRAIRSETR